MTARDPGDRPSATDVAAELAYLPADSSGAQDRPATRPDEPAPTRPTEVISEWITARPSGTRILPAGAPERRARAWSTQPLVWAALIAALLVVLLVLVLTTGSDNPSPNASQTSPPTYPAVSGLAGKHLRQLDGVAAQTPLRGDVHAVAAALAAHHPAHARTALATLDTDAAKAHATGRLDDEKFAEIQSAATTLAGDLGRNADRPAATVTVTTGAPAPPTVHAPVPPGHGGTPPGHAGKPPGHGPKGPGQGDDQGDDGGGD
jgi:hypothetical protein